MKAIPLVDGRIAMKTIPPVDGRGALDDVADFLARFVVFSTTAQRDAVALWVAHAHGIAAAESTPYLSIESAERRSGKTRLLEVLELLVPRPLRSAGASESALFRSIDGVLPATILMDEVDALFGRPRADTEGLRGLLNAGNRRGAVFLRCVGDGSKQTVKPFPVFAAKVLAGIGQLPDTIADRSIRIRLKRRTKAERVERFRFRDVAPEAKELCEELDRWLREASDDLLKARPAVPDELNDRAADAWEPLLAIADDAGYDWPERARKAAVGLSVEAEADDSFGARLLVDLHQVFTEDRVTSRVLCDRLVAIEEAPWGDLRGKPIDPRALARLLRKYDVLSGTVKLADGATAKGYKREDLEDAWKRYAPQKAPANVTSVTSQSPSGISPILEASPNGSGDVREKAQIPHGKREVTEVTFRAPETGGEPVSGHILSAEDIAENEEYARHLREGS